MRMRAIGAILMVLALGAMPAFAGPDGSLDLFPYGVDPGTGAATTVDFGACSATPAPIFGGFGNKIIVGVYARLSNATLAGISGAELYVDGVETLPLLSNGATNGYTVTVTYPANTLQAFAATAICLPRDVGGTLERRQNTTWTDVTGPDAQNCQKAALTEIARIELQQTGVPAPVIPDNTYLSVVAGDPPGGALNCPLLVLCDFPVYTQVCVTGGQFIINPNGLSCTVAVSNTTWGAMKDLYR